MVVVNSDPSTDSLAQLDQFKSQPTMGMGHKVSSSKLSKKKMADILSQNENTSMTSPMTHY